MQISNHLSPSFGSIQVNLSEMNREQRMKSDALFDTIKYSDRYQSLEHEDFDIYILPNKRYTNKIDVKFMDPYSGEFVRDNKNKIIKKTLETSDINGIWDFTDKVLDSLQKMVKGIYKRPDANIEEVVNGRTTMAILNPAKGDIGDGVEEFKKCGYTQKEAEELAFEEFKELYHVANRDADF